MVIYAGRRVESGNDGRTRDAKVSESVNWHVVDHDVEFGALGWF